MKIIHGAHLFFVFAVFARMVVGNALPSSVESVKHNVSVPPEPADTTTAESSSPITPTTVSPTTNATTTTLKPTSTTTAPNSTNATTTAIPLTTTPQSTTPKPVPMTSSTQPSITTTAVPGTTASPGPTLAPSQNRHFDGLSFMGGIILATCVVAIGIFSLKFYKARTERNYHTL